MYTSEIDAPGIPCTRKRREHDRALPRGGRGTNLNGIFGRLVEGRFAPDVFAAEVVAAAAKLVPMTVTLWNRIQQKMLPTPTQFYQHARALQGALAAAALGLRLPSAGVPLANAFVSSIPLLAHSHPPPPSPDPAGLPGRHTRLALPSPAAQQAQPRQPRQQQVGLLLHHRGGFGVSGSTSAGSVLRVRLSLALRGQQAGAVTGMCGLGGDQFQRGSGASERLGRHIAAVTSRLAVRQPGSGARFGQVDPCPRTFCWLQQLGFAALGPLLPLWALQRGLVVQ